MALPGTLLVICCYCCCSVLLGVFARTSSPRYHSESPEVGRLVQRYDGRHDHRRPHELGFGYYYQGDIMLPEQQSVDRVSLSNKFPSSVWPNGVVPYYFAPDTFKPNEIYMIEKAMDEFHRQTCVRFVLRTPQTPYYVTITNRETGCFASIGRRENNGQNLLNLQTPNCLYGGTPVHEMMHVLGFLHEVSRADRDEYIHIDRSALARQYQTGNFFAINFGKDVDGSTTTYNISYNYGSIMHYSKTAGSVDGRKQVLFNLKPYAKDDFGSDRLTAPDIESVKYRYCQGSSSGDGLLSDDRCFRDHPQGSATFQFWPLQLEELYFLPWTAVADDAICKYKKGENIKHQFEHLSGPLRKNHLYNRFRQRMPKSARSVETITSPRHRAHALHIHIPRLSVQ